MDRAVIAVSAALLGATALPAAAAAEDPPAALAAPAPAPIGVVIEGGARLVLRPDVRVAVAAPPEAATLEVAADASFAAAQRVASGPRIAVRLAPGGDGDERAVWVRALDAAGAPVGLPGSDRVRLDDTPPALVAARLRPLEPVLVCAPGGRAVAGTARSRMPLRVELDATDRGTGRPQAQVTTTPGSPGPWRAAEAVDLAAPAGGRVFVRLRDRGGATGPWAAAAVPAAPERVASAETLPFTTALECPGPGPAERTARVRAGFRGGGYDRAILRVPGSALDWTWYSGQGLALNWVHVGTYLDARLSREPLARYRAAVSEVLSYSTVDSDGPRRYRVNENRFTTPDDGRPPPWRDAMGSGVILAALAPAIAPDAPAGERDLARRAASEYLEAFSVSHRRGGLVWSDGGPGAWYLEYTFRTEARVLNGFMQSVVSLARFARQSERLSVRDPAWAPLAARARERVRAGATAAARWLPAYDLGGGATRYSLTSGAAPAKYRAYHVELLRMLAAIPYVSDRERSTFLRYRAAWS